MAQTEQVVEDLGEFEGEEVLLSKVIVQGFGDGLSDAVGLKAHAYSRGDTICMVIEAKVKRVAFEADPKTEDIARIHTTRLITAIEVAEADVQTYLAIARDRKRKVEDSKSGQTSLLDGEGDGESDGDGEAMQGAGLGPEGEFDPENLPEGDAEGVTAGLRVEDDE